jgi:hypothetical protein
VNRRSLLTLSTSAFLTGAYALYEVLVSPLVSPGPELFSERAATASMKPLTESVAELQAAKYLADQTWPGERPIADAKYQVQVANQATFVFAEKWEPIENTGRVRITPFAMIWRKKGDDLSKPPITLVCESAVLEFKDKFRLADVRHPGRIVGGAFEGPVAMRGPNGLTIDGRDFFISEAELRAWSDNPIRFTYGPNSGRGHGLELDLIRESGKIADDQPAIAGVRTVRLLRDVHMDLSGKPRSDGAPGDAVQVTSAGSFEFGVESYVAKFQKDVHVVHPTPGGQFDELRDCDTLTLIFEPERKEDAKRQGQAESVAAERETGAADADDLQFRRLRAEGQRAIVISQRSEMQARMQELIYDDQLRVVALRDAKRVELTQRNNRLSCPEVTASLDEAGRIIEATCRGEGELYRFAEDALPPRQRGRERAVEFSARWLDQLRMEPDPKEQLDLIELTGQATLLQPGRMSLQADVIRLWVTPEEHDEPRAGTHDRSSVAGADRARPRKMLARGHAAFGSPQLTGATERLEIWFEDAPESPAEMPRAAGGARQTGNAPAPKSQIVAVAASRPAQVRGGPSRGGEPRAGEETAPRGKSPATAKSRGGRSSSTTPAPATAASEPPRDAPAAREVARGAPQKSPDNPIHVVADAIQVRTVMHGDDPQVAEVITEGRVYVSRNNREGANPFELRGDRLHLWNHAQNAEVIHVQGKPAHIKDRGLNLEGGDVHFDRGRNFAFVDGPGVLTLPVTKGLDGRSLDRPQPLRVFWKEKMDFDGATANFYTDVNARLHSAEMRSDMHCEEMQVLLARRISFSEDADRNQQSDSDIRKVICRDNVVFESYASEQGRLSEIRKGNSFDFTFDNSTGQITAQGPGLLKFWRRSSGKRTGPGNVVAAKANKAAQADSAEWEYSRIKFSGTMGGNAGTTATTPEKRTVTFHDRVQIINGPVAAATEEINPDADELPKGANWMRCQSLEVIQQPAQGAQNSYLQIVGHDNVELECRTEQGLYTAKAATASYDQSKELFTLTGNGQRGATLWRGERLGAETPVGTAQRILFVPSRDELLPIHSLSIDRATGAQGSP